MIDKNPGTHLKALAILGLLLPFAARLNAQTNTFPATGNVGIGTTSPSGLLTVHGTEGSIVFQPSLYPGYLLIDGSAVYGFEINNTAPGGKTRLYGSGGVQLRTAGADPALAVTQAGNVGIGTTSPQYKLAVNGTIGTKEVVVTNTGWADYVLRPEYSLKPLNDVAAYIRQHGTLPDIPSEEEVRTNGVSVGEMQAKLLAKIEELTLHAIRAENANASLKAENQALQERIARIERLVGSER